jgi:hypothetical protein
MSPGRGVADRGAGVSPPVLDGTYRREARHGERNDGTDAHERVKARVAARHTNLLTSAARLTRDRESRGFASPGHPGFAFSGQPPGWDGSHRLAERYRRHRRPCTRQPSRRRLTLDSRHRHLRS